MLLMRGLVCFAAVLALCVSAHATNVSNITTTTVPTTQPVSKPTSRAGSPPDSLRWLNDGLHDLDRQMAKIDPRVTPKAFSPTFYWENDGAYTKIYDPSDRHYTAGAGLSMQWQSLLSDDLISSIPSIDNEYASKDPRITYASGIIASLRIYTPRDLDNPEPMQDDRPYAGWTYAGPILQRADRSANTPTMEHFELDLGTMGPRSQAGYAQYSVHQTFGAETPEGWRYQTHDECGADFKYQRHWRTDLQTDADGQPIAQLIPYADTTLGTIHVNASVGAVLRYGVNLPDDFGPSRLDWPGDFTSPLAGQSTDSSIYVFVRPAVRAVAHDATMGDSFFHDNIVEAEPNPLVFEIQAGIAVHFTNHVKLTYSQTFDSLEFEGQKQWDSYGSLVLSSEWTW